MKIFLERRPVGLAIRVEIKSAEPVEVLFEVENHDRWFYWKELGLTKWEKEISSETGDIALTVEIGSIWAYNEIKLWLNSLSKRIGLSRQQLVQDESESTGFEPYLNIECFFDGEPLQIPAGIMDKLNPKEQCFEVGEFPISSGICHVTDPCYKTEISNCTLSIPALEGIWKAQCTIGPTSWNTRVKSLQCRHESVTALDISEKINFFEEVGAAAVDSGQLGFFDKELYLETQAGVAESLFYDQCCDTTQADDKHKAGVPAGYDFGVVSDSGFGDGVYVVRALKNKNGQAIALIAVFVDEPGDLKINEFASM